MKKNNKGFSLAELIVVVLILGILAVAVTPQVMNWIDKSKVAKDKNYAGTVATAVESVALEYVGLGKATDITTSLTLNDSGISETTDFADDVEEMIGTGKCKKPEQANMTHYAITVTVTDGKTVAVDVQPAGSGATP